MRFKKYNLVLVVIMMVYCVGCTDQGLFDEHYDTLSSGEVVDNNVMEKLSGVENCSNFYNALVTYKFDTLLTKNFPVTVFAPVNAEFDLANIAEEDHVRTLNNHILYGKFFTSDLTERKKMLSEKYLNFAGNGTDVLVDNSIHSIAEQSNIQGSNGIVHVVEDVVPYKKNVYQYLNANSEFFQRYFELQIDSVMDKDNSPWTGEFNEDGMKVYDTIWVERNHFLSDVVDLTNEQNEYTVIAANSEIFNSYFEENVVKYFGTMDAIPDATISSVMENVVGTSVFPEKYVYDELPDQLFSVLYTEVDIDKDAITDRDLELSNGVLHSTTALELDKSSFLTTNKIVFGTDVIKNRTVDVQVSDPNISLRWDVTKYLIYNTVKGDIGEWIQFPLNDMLKTTYDVYFGTGTSYGSQMVQMSFHRVDEEGNVEETPFHTFEPYEGAKTVNEKHFGEVTFEAFGNYMIRFTYMEDPPSTPKSYSMRMKTLKLIPQE
ncbi:hypothetical protein EYV94_08385 [Puteibacter caeruleilacunae]|nr:hypothetical protein EYV94_08385 [Puteibacter caeruleilacunae]